MGQYGKFFDNKHTFKSNADGQVMIEMDLTHLSQDLVSATILSVISAVTDDFLERAAGTNSPCPECGVNRKSFTMTDQCPTVGLRRDFAVLMCPACKDAEYVPIDIKQQ